MRFNRSMRRGRQDRQVSSQRTELSSTGNTQRETTVVITDPDPKLVFIGLGIVGGDGQSDRWYCAFSQLNRFFLERVDKDRRRLIFDKHRHDAAPGRRQIKSPQCIKE